MDWNKAIEVAVTAAGSGGASFVGAFLRFKQRLKEAEDNAKAAASHASAALKDCAALITEHDALAIRVGALSHAIESVSKGWRLELDSLKAEYARDQRHREELEEARAEARQSRPDPVEAIRHELDQLRRQLERMKERQGSYVRSETFAEHARAQEKQWHEIQRTLGHLEALAKS